MSKSHLYENNPIGATSLRLLDQGCSANGEFIKRDIFYLWCGSSIYFLITAALTFPAVE